ncbi:MAG: nicotinate-nicotinamide nucleotide adenylyltransferase [Myxococcales bacterium]|nr:nicotinate-nicotinamide nucleotide adenylyltransferase [Myxococcales bacterium]
MTARTPVAIFGGSFNPPHVAHVLAVTYTLAFGGIQELLVVPVFEHAFSKDLAPFVERVELCRLAFGWLPRVRVSAVEAELPTPSFTLQTLERLAEEHPEWALRLVIGSDVLHERDKWRAFERIERLAPPLVLGRAGFPHPSAPLALLPEVSSTEVRGLLGATANAARDIRLRALVPRDVLAYIDERGLYR